MNNNTRVLFVANNFFIISISVNYNGDNYSDQLITFVYTGLKLF